MTCKTASYELANEGRDVGCCVYLPVTELVVSLPASLSVCLSVCLFLVYMSCALRCNDSSRL